MQREVYKPRGHYFALFLIFDHFDHFSPVKFNVFCFFDNLTIFDTLLLSTWFMNAPKGNPELTLDGQNIGTQMAGHTLHYGGGYPENGWPFAHYEKIIPEGFDKDFHKFQVNWTPDFIEFGVDDEIVSFIYSKVALHLLPKNSTVNCHRCRFQL